jgi:hypothetical protein
MCAVRKMRKIFKLSSDGGDYGSNSRLGGVVVSVLETGPKGRGFKPGREDGFLRAIKISSTPSLGWEVKPEDFTAC